jgi:hypothetical protein
MKILFLAKKVNITNRRKKKKRTPFLKGISPKRRALLRGEK